MTHAVAQSSFRDLSVIPMLSHGRMKIRMPAPCTSADTGLVSMLLGPHKSMRLAVEVWWRSEEFPGGMVP